MSLLSDFPLSTFLKIPSFWLDKGEGREGACEQKFKWLQAHFYFIYFPLLSPEICLMFFLLCLFPCRRRCSSGGENGPTGPPAPGAVVEE